MLSTMQEGDGNEKRPYRMRARAKATEETGDRILDAAESVFDEMPIDELTLEAIAERSGVTVQTVLRHYGSRQGVLAAALGRLFTKVGGKRNSAPTGDVAGAINVLIDHYDEVGDRILLLLANEERNRLLHALTDAGRVYHQEWCERVFAPGLEGLKGAERERRIAQIVAITDLYVWKVLRREKGLSRRQTKLAMQELLEPLMGDRS
jgi:AcrR family transcriptional regulator